jgi:epoxyqueuosine reductase
VHFDLGTLREQIGWDLVGVCPPTISPERAEFFRRWLKDKKGPQMEYLSRRSDERCAPELYLPTVKSIICFGLYYFPGWAQGDVKFSNYSWGPDYHQVLKSKLESSTAILQKMFPGSDIKALVDTAPALEKVLATQAGLGWQGKNTLLIHPKLGSMIFLGELYTSIPLSHFEAPSIMKDHCGTCSRCIDACPTQALTPYELDAARCISYWTLEHRGPFDQTTPVWENWVAGCDICQEVCPWNSKLIPLSIQNPYLEHIEQIRNGENLKSLLREKALNYVPLENWKRNLQQIYRKS